MTLIRWYFHRSRLFPASLPTVLSQASARARKAPGKFSLSHTHLLTFLTFHPKISEHLPPPPFGGWRNPFGDFQAHRGTWLWVHRAWADLRFEGFERMGQKYKCLAFIEHGLSVRHHVQCFISTSYPHDDL